MKPDQNHPLIQQSTAKANIPGGTKVLVVTATQEDYTHFRAINPQAARMMFRVNKGQEIIEQGKAEVMLFGPFWAHPNWDEMYRAIRQKTAFQPHVVVMWFPA